MLCVSVTALAATYLVYMSKVKWHNIIVSCRLLKIHGFCWKRFVQEIWHYLPATMIGDSAFLAKNTPMVLVTITNVILAVLELQIRSNASHMCTLAWYTVIDMTSSNGVEHTVH